MFYPKINSLYLRDERNHIMPGYFSEPIFEFFPYWECTEKIDGTNTRVELRRDEDGSWGHTSFGGRTPKTIMVPELVERLSEIFSAIDWDEIFPDVHPGETVILFGEGFGAKIQGGDDYHPGGVDFILFDVFSGGRWLTRESCEEVAQKLGIRIVPFVGMLSLEEAEEMVREGFPSQVSLRPKQAEGLVLKAPFGLLDHNGNRIMTKLKTKDFDTLKNI